MRSRACERRRVSWLIDGADQLHVIDIALWIAESVDTSQELTTAPSVLRAHSARLAVDAFQASDRAVLELVLVAVDG